MSAQNAKPGDKVELADKDTGFYDSDTKFKVVRDQQVKLGGKIGERTHQALLSGDLLVVGGGSKRSEATEPTDDYDIPADLPGREAFVAAGLTSFDQIKALETDEQLLEVKGIGPGTVKNIKAWAKANAPKE